MGNVKIRYYVTRRGGRWGYWAPCLARRNGRSGKIEPTLMAKLGFKLIDCGRDGPAAWAIAESWNRKWLAARKEYRSGHAVDVIADTNGPQARERQRELRVYPENSVGEAFAAYRKTNDWRKTKKPRTREDWWRGWDLIEPTFGDVDPRTISLAEIDLWYAGDPEDDSIEGLLQRVGVREAHRAMKIWRAMWPKMASLNRPDGQRYVISSDSSLGVRRKTPQSRSAFWFEGEAVRLVKRAIRMKYFGAAAALAVAWDSQLSPVDVVSLTKGKLTIDAGGPMFVLDRTKTGVGAIATLGGRAVRVLDAYLATLPDNYHPDAPIFLSRGGTPGPKGGRPRPPVVYTVPKLGKDFAAIRDQEFPGDTRQLSDFRRSGSIEADAGGVDDKALAKKMANTIDKSPELRKTYIPPGVVPPNPSVVRLADEARKRGRTRMRGGGTSGGGK